MTFLDVLPDSDEEFRQLARTWLHDNVVDKFAELKGRGGPGDEDIGFCTFEGDRCGNCEAFEEKGSEGGVS